MRNRHARKDDRTDRQNAGDGLITSAEFLIETGLESDDNIDAEYPDPQQNHEAEYANAVGEQARASAGGEKKARREQDRRHAEHKRQFILKINGLSGR